MNARKMPLSTAANTSNNIIESEDKTTHDSVEDSNKKMKDDQSLETSKDRLASNDLEKNELDKENVVFLDSLDKYFRDDCKESDLSENDKINCDTHIGKSNSLKSRSAENTKFSEKNKVIDNLNQCDSVVSLDRNKNNMEENKDNTVSRELIQQKTNDLDVECSVESLLKQIDDATNENEYNDVLTKSPNNSIVRKFDNFTNSKIETGGEQITSLSNIIDEDDCVVRTSVAEKKNFATESDSVEMNINTVRKDDEEEELSNKSKIEYDKSTTNNIGLVITESDEMIVEKEKYETVDIEDQSIVEDVESNISNIESADTEIEEVEVEKEKYKTSDVENLLIIKSEKLSTKSKIEDDCKTTNIDSINTESNVREEEKEEKETTKDQLIIKATELSTKSNVEDVNTKTNNMESVHIQSDVMELDKEEYKTSDVDSKTINLEPVSTENNVREEEKESTNLEDQIIIKVKELLTKPNGEDVDTKISNMEPIQNDVIEVEKEKCKTSDVEDTLIIKSKELSTKSNIEDVESKTSDTEPVDMESDVTEIEKDKNKTSDVKDILIIKSKESSTNISKVEDAESKSSDTEPVDAKSDAIKVVEKEKNETRDVENQLINSKELSTKSETDNFEGKTTNVPVNTECDAMEVEIENNETPDVEDQLIKELSTKSKIDGEANKTSIMKLVDTESDVMEVEKERYETSDLEDQLILISKNLSTKSKIDDKNKISNMEPTNAESDVMEVDTEKDETSDVDNAVDQEETCHQYIENDAISIIDITLDVANIYLETLEPKDMDEDEMSTKNSDSDVIEIEDEEDNIEELKNKSSDENTGLTVNYSDKEIIDTSSDSRIHNDNSNIDQSSDNTIEKKLKSDDSQKDSLNKSILKNALETGQKVTLLADNSSPSYCVYSNTADALHNCQANNTFFGLTNNLYVLTDNEDRDSSSSPVEHRDDSNSVLVVEAVIEGVSTRKKDENSKTFENKVKEWPDGNPKDGIGEKNVSNSDDVEMICEDIIEITDDMNNEVVVSGESKTTTGTIEGEENSTTEPSAKTDIKKTPKGENVKNKEQTIPNEENIGAKTDNGDTISPRDLLNQMSRAELENNFLTALEVCDHYKKKANAIEAKFKKSEEFALALEKRSQDLEIVVDKLIEDLQKDNDKRKAPLRIKRSVGLQVLIYSGEDPNETLSDIRNKNNYMDIPPDDLEDALENIEGVEREPEEVELDEQENEEDVELIDEPSTLDLPSGSQLDSKPDSPQEVPPDSPLEIPLDSPQEVPLDSPQEVPLDSPQEVPPDSPQGVPPVSPREVPPKSAPDLPTDSSQDQPPESSQDQPLESSQDQPPESLQGQPPESSQDQPPESSQDQPPDLSRDLPRDSSLDLPSDQPIVPEKTSVQEIIKETEVLDKTPSSKIIPTPTKTNPVLSEPGLRLEKRTAPVSDAVTVDLTDDEPPPKQVKPNSPRCQQTLPNPNSVRKMLIPISRVQTPRPRPALINRTVIPNPARGSGPIVMRMAQNSNVRLRHPAPLPEAKRQIHPSNWKLLPPAPDLKISKVGNGIVISWKIDGYLQEKYEEIASYQLFAYQETSALPSTAMWKKIGDVKALPLPMACTLTQFMSGFKYYFAVRAVDIRSRIGPFSLPGSILLLSK